MKALPIKPFGDRYLVQIVPNKKRESSIILPETAPRDKSLEGVVVAVGTACGKSIFAQDGAPGLKVGDRILWSGFGDTEVHYDGKQYLMLNPGDILAIL